MKLRYLHILLLFFLVFSGTACDTPTKTEDPVINETFECNCADLIDSWYNESIQGLVSSRGVSIQLFSDQLTSTNLDRDYYNTAQEPRLPLPNDSEFPNRENIDIYYRIFHRIFNYSASSGSQHKFDTKFLAHYYFINGLAKGYMGLLFDQAPYWDVSSEEFQIYDYSTLIDSALSDLDKAIDHSSKKINQTRPVQFDFDGFLGYNPNWSEIYLRKLANSFAARILAGKARTYEKALQTDWEKVLHYAENGLEQRNGSDTFALSNIGSQGEQANYLIDFSSRIVSGDIYTGAGFLPVDIKILHLLDETYPTEYPPDSVKDGILTYPEAKSSDQRLNEYYNYTQNKGFLNENRNRALFSNYLNKRMYSGNNWWQASNKIILFTETEIQYLKAEAHIMLGNYPQAAQILNESPAGTGVTQFDFELPALRGGIITQNGVSGNHYFDGSESLAEMQLALLREYSVELEGLGGVGLQWFFMRRHDLLQEGTPTMYPIPDFELSALGLANYTFGGVENAGQPGTASGANSWKNLRAKIAQGQ